MRVLVIRDIIMRFSFWNTYCIWWTYREMIIVPDILNA